MHNNNPTSILRRRLLKCVQMGQNGVFGKPHKELIRRIEGLKWIRRIHYMDMAYPYRQFQ
nr:hypothetical protein [Tanacetum cinerariifolium]